MLKNNKGEAILAAYAVFGLISIMFATTVVNGTFKNQIQKIKDAHNAPITVDNVVTGSAGNFK